MTVVQYDGGGNCDIQLQSIKLDESYNGTLIHTSSTGVRIGTGQEVLFCGATYQKLYRLAFPWWAFWRRKEKKNWPKPFGSPVWMGTTEKTEPTNKIKDKKGKGKKGTLVNVRSVEACQEQASLDLYATAHAQVTRARLDNLVNMMGAAGMREGRLYNATQEAQWRAFQDQAFDEWTQNRLRRRNNDGIH